MLGYLNKLTHHDGSFEQRKWDLSGNLLEESLYGANQALLSRSTHTYNQLDQRIRSFSEDHLTGRTLEIVSEYDLASRPVRIKEQALATGSREIYYTYDQVHDRESITLPFLQKKLSYTRNHRGQKSKVELEDLLHITMHFKPRF